MLLAATIAADRRPVAVNAVAGPRALVRAAVAAVRQWEFSPQREPLRVLVGVTFSLAADRSPLEPIPILRGGNVRMPVKIKDVQPVYPPEAREAGVQGTVVVGVTIDREGRIRDAYILESVPALDAAALDAVLQWEFTPLLKQGVPTPVELTVPIKFRSDSGRP